MPLKGSIGTDSPGDIPARAEHQHLPGCQGSQRSPPYRRTLLTIISNSKKQYYQLSEELDTLVEEFKKKRPTTGLSYLREHLLQQRWGIQRDRPLASISPVDSVQKVLRKNLAIKRRKYISCRPNAMWHMDGHHKLGPWGFVVHASINGCDSIVGSH